MKMSVKNAWILWHKRPNHGVLFRFTCLAWGIIKITQMHLHFTKSQYQWKSFPQLAGWFDEGHTHIYLCKTAETDIRGSDGSAILTYRCNIRQQTFQFFVIIFP